MSQEILIIGESGSGKSTSLETLDPKSTLLSMLQKSQCLFEAGRKTLAL